MAPLRQKWSATGGLAQKRGCIRNGNAGDAGCRDPVAARAPESGVFKQASIEQFRPIQTMDIWGIPDEPFLLGAW